MSGNKSRALEEEEVGRASPFLGHYSQDEGILEDSLYALRKSLNKYTWVPVQGGLLGCLRGS